MLELQCLSNSEEEEEIGFESAQEKIDISLRSPLHPHLQGTSEKPALV
jgi:hypothetical protein